MANYEMDHPIIYGGVGSPQSIGQEFSVAATNQTRATGYHPVGTRGVLPDGRVFYYASNGAVAVTEGELMMISGHVRHADHDNTALTATGAVGIGTTTIIFSETDLDTTDIMENEYADGFLWVNDVTGEGQSFKIVGHERIDASGSANRRIELATPVRTALGATSQVSFSRNSYDRIIQTSTSAAEFVVGVCGAGGLTASTAIATDVTTTEVATTTYFGWVQTWGAASVRIGGTTAEAAPVMSGTAAGEVEAWTGSTGATPPLDFAQVGVVMGLAAADTEYQLVDLRIRP
jgi:hypothetical protein